MSSSPLSTFHYGCYAEYTIKDLLESCPDFYVASEDTESRLGYVADCRVSTKIPKISRELEGMQV